MKAEKQKTDEVTSLPSSAVYTGTQINYFMVCRRKLWLFSRNVKMEHESDLVKLGRLLHESSYRRSHEVMLDSIAIDFIREDDQLVLHEVKKSRALEKAHVMQLLYYLYYLKNRGVEAVGKIDYPKLRKTMSVKLTAEKEEEMEDILRSIHEILTGEGPPEVVKKRICRKCSYFEFCWI